MNVTIIADASHCPETGAGGYGFWIACGRGRIGGNGEFKLPVESSCTAEMQAIINALHSAIKKGLVCKEDIVLIQTDCQQAIDNFLKFRTGTTHEQKLVKILYELENKNNLDTRFKHVPGHTSGHEPRLAANNTCDRQARAHMRKARGRILEVTKVLKK